MITLRLDRKESQFKAKGRLVAGTAIRRPLSLGRLVVALPVVALPVVALPVVALGRLTIARPVVSLRMSVLLRVLVLLRLPGGPCRPACA